MHVRKTCPGCGAPLDDFKCRYCGSVFYDFADMSFDTPVYIKIRRQDQTCLLLKARLSECNLTISKDPATELYLNHEVFCMATAPPKVELSTRFIDLKEEK